MADQDPVFNIQRVYLKEASLEQPNSPAILLDQEQPSVEINLGVNAENVAEGIFEITVTATVQTKIQDKTVFLCECKQAGIFEVRNVPDSVYGFEVSPATVDITLHGPVRLLDALDASTLTAWVDATGVNPRRKQLHTRVVRFDPPEGLTASELKPDKVTLLQLDPPPDAAPAPPDGGEDAGAPE